MGCCKLTALLAIVAGVLYWRCQHCNQARNLHIDGFVAPGFEKVRDVFRQHVESGFEKGGSFAAYYRGQLVINVWGGTANDLTAEPWNEHHISQYFSCTKGLAGILVAMFVDRGLLSYDAKVAQYWPEFAQNGKENITVRQMVSHQGGLAVVKEPFELYKVCHSVKELSELMERQTPIWTPGEHVGYHAFTHGMLIEALLHRVDPKHRRIDQIFREEIAEPYDVDIHIGLPTQLLHRFTPIDYSELKSLKAFINSLPLLPLFVKRFLWPTEQDKLSDWAFNNPSDFLPADPPELNMRPANLAIPLMSTHGFGTARSLAKIWAIVANQGRPLNEKRTLCSEQHSKSTSQCAATDKALFSSQVLAEFSQMQKAGNDFIYYGMPITMGLGLVMINRTESDGQTYQLVGHGGHGGQMGYADLRKQLAFGYVTNHLASGIDAINNPRFKPLYDALYDCVARQQ